MSLTRYNPNYPKDWSFNTESKPDFAEITEQDNEAAQERLDELVRDTREDIQE
jgi:hypothetical protein